MRLALALVLAISLAQPALAHDGAAYPATAKPAARGAGPALPFPIEITPRFALIDQVGHAVTEKDFAGRPMAVFFGYASCEAICPVALASLAAALDLLGPEGVEIAPILITVDPARDTPAVLARRLARYHPRLIGLTGSEAALAEARAVFQVEISQVAETPAGAPLYAHGSFIYLVGRDGVVKSLLPPILSPERMAELMRKVL
jgi:protein SCO1/2